MVSVGPPCVAQRVWPIPLVVTGVFFSASSRFINLPARFSTNKGFPRCVGNAIPAESYPRYSRRRNPSITGLRAELLPV